MKKLLGIAFLLLLVAAPVSAADFLTSARGGGMGFSYFLLSDDASGALYNPSALGFTKGWQSHLMYAKLNDYEYQIVKEKPYYGQFGVVYSRPNLGTFALNSIQSGSFSKLTNIPTFNHMALSYGRQLSPSWSLGGSLKYLLETGFGERSAFDLDLGFSYRAPYGLTAAFAAENIIRSALSPDYLGMKEYLPRRFRFGAGYTFAAEKFQGALLLSNQFEEWGVSEKTLTNLTNLATEWWFFQDRTVSFATRGGYSFGKALQFDRKTDYSGPTLGTSINWNLGLNNVRLDYAWQKYPFETNDGSSPSNHFVAMTFGWGGVPTFGPSRADRPAQPQALQPKAPAQPKPAESLKKPTSAPAPVEVPLKVQETNVEQAKYMPFDVEMEVSSLIAMDTKRIVFYVRPRQVVKTTFWRLYVFKAKIKEWNEEEAQRWALATVEGKGVPPINIIWNGTGSDGEYIPGGKYFFILTATSSKGEKFATEWHSFKLQ